MTEPLDLDTFEREYRAADSGIMWELTRDELGLVWDEVFRLRAALAQAEQARGHWQRAFQDASDMVRTREAERDALAQQVARLRAPLEWARDFLDGWQGEMMPEWREWLDAQVRPALAALSPAEEA